MTELSPTEGSTSTTISGPQQPKKSWMRSGRPVDSSTDEEVAGNGIKQSVVVQHEYEGPPRLHLRESLRHSFTRGSILSKKPQI